MNNLSVHKIYKFYEVFNDFNRIRILACLNKDVKTSKDISEYIGINETIVLTQLEYLSNYNIVIEYENNGEKKFKIIDKSVGKIVDYILKYVNKIEE